MEHCPFCRQSILPGHFLEDQPDLGVQPDPPAERVDINNERAKLGLAPLRKPISQAPPDVEQNKNKQT